MPTIRPHKKSRDGCLGCKRRKIKCDEVHPSCTFCSSRRVHCVYPIWPTKAARSPAGSSPKSTSSASSPIDNALSHRSRVPSPIATQLSPDIGLEVGELKLMHNYSVSLSPVLGFIGPDVRATTKVLQGDIPRLAFSHDFLMYAVLSLSSHHLQLLTGEANGDTTKIARRTEFYLDAALRGYRNAISNLNAENIEAVLAASAIMVIIATKHYVMHVEGELWVVSYLGLHAGMLSIASIFGEEKLLESPISMLLNPNNKHDESCVPNILKEMLSPPDSTNLTARQISVLEETLHCLGKLYGALGLGVSRRSQGKLFIKIMLSGKALPVQFVTLVRQQVPQALVLLAHYLCFLKFGGMEAEFLVENVQNDISVILNTLDPYWMRYMQTPSRIFSTRVRQEVVAELMLQLPEDAFQLTNSPTSPLYGANMDKRIAEVLDTHEVATPEKFLPRFGVPTTLLEKLNISS